MSLISLDYKSPMLTFMQNEHREFMQKRSGDSVKAMFAQEPTGNDVCVRVIPNNTSFQTLLKVNRLVHKHLEDVTKVPYPGEYNQFFNAITSSIVSINNAGNFEACISKIDSVRNSLGPLFYGALLLDGEIMINPLHPLVAMRMLSKNGSIEPSRNFRLAIFTYSSPEKYAELYNEYNEAEVDIERVISNINAQISCYASKVDDEVKVINSGASASGVKIEYVVKKDPLEESDRDYYLSAHQVLTKGIAMPYYGTSIISMGAETSGISVTPMRSCNISRFRENNQTYLNAKNTLATTSPDFTSVCTGSEDNRTLKGIRTLTHSNASSPYTTAIIATGALTYAAECVNKSMQIYTQAKILKEK